MRDRKIWPRILSLKLLAAKLRGILQYKQLLSIIVRSLIPLRRELRSLCIFNYGGT